MFRRKNKDRTSSLNTAYTGVESLPRGRHAANPAAVAAANTVGNDRLNSMSSTLSSAAAAAALMRHNSLTSISSQQGPYSANGRANSLMGTSSTGRARPISGSLSSNSFRNNSLTSRYSQGPARTTTTVERSNNGRTMSLTTTTVRRFGSFELVKTNTTTGQVRRPTRQSLRPGYAASALSFESDLDPVYENGAVSSPKMDRSPLAQQAAQIKFPTLEEEDEEEVPIKHNPGHRSVSPMRSALKDSRSPSVTSSNEEQFTGSNNNNLLKVSNLKKTNSMSKTRKASRVSFAGYDEDDHDSDNATHYDVKEAAARQAGTKDQKQKDNTANDGFLADHRKKVNATAAASAATKSPSLANTADWPAQSRSFLKVSRMDDSDSGASDGFIANEKSNKRSSRVGRSTSDNGFVRPSAIMNHANGSLRKTASQKRSSGFFGKRESMIKPDQLSDDSQAKTLTSPTETKVKEEIKTKPESPKEKKKTGGIGSAAVAFAAALVGEGRADTPSERSSSDLGSSTAVSPPRSPLANETTNSTVSESDLEENHNDQSRTKTLTAGPDHRVGSGRESEVDGSVRSEDGFETPDSVPQEDGDAVEIMNLDDTRPLARKEESISKGEEVSPYRALDPRVYGSEEEESDKRTIKPGTDKRTMPSNADIKKSNADVKKSNTKQNGIAITTSGKVANKVTEEKRYPEQIIQRQQSLSTDDLREEDFSDALDVISMNSDSSWKNNRQPKPPKQVIRLSMRSKDTARVTPTRRPVSVLSVPTKPGKHLGASSDMVAPPRKSPAFARLSLRDKTSTLTTSEINGQEGNNIGFKSRFADSDSDDELIPSNYNQPLDKSKVNKGGLLTSLRPRTSKKNLRFSSTDLNTEPITMPEIAEIPESTKQSNGSVGGSKFKHVFSPTNQTKYLVSKSGTDSGDLTSSTNQINSPPTPSTQTTDVATTRADYPRKKKFSGLRKLFKLD